MSFKGHIPKMIFFLKSPPKLVVVASLALLFVQNLTCQSISVFTAVTFGFSLDQKKIKKIDFLFTELFRLLSPHFIPMTHFFLFFHRPLLKTQTVLLTMKH